MGASIGRKKFTALLLYDIDSWVLSYMAESLQKHLTDCGVVKVLAGRTPSTVTAWKHALDGIDVVHFLSPWDFFKWAGFIPKPVVVTVHHLTQNTIDAMQVKHSLADVIACTNPQCHRQLEELGIVGPSGVLRIRYGIDTAHFRPIEGARGDLIQRLGIPPETILLGFSAKPSSDDARRKGVDRYWRLVERLQETLEQPVALVLFGPGPDKLDGWKREAIPASIAQSVHLAGQFPVSELPPLYGGLDYYICLSRVEGGPYPVFETMACGVVNFSTPVGIVPELISDGETGFIVSEENYLDRIPKLIRELAGDPERRHQVAARAIAAAATQFSWKVAADPEAYRQLYNCAVHNRKTRPLLSRLYGQFRFHISR